MFVVALILAVPYLVGLHRPVTAVKATPAMPTAIPVVTPTAVPTVAPTGRYACLEISKAFGQAIAEGAKPDAPIHFVRGQAFKSLDFQTYFISVEFAALGIGNQVAVFVSTSLTDASKVMAADEMAGAFTVWPDVAKVDPVVAKARYPIDRVIACLR